MPLITNLPLLSVRDMRKKGIAPGKYHIFALMDGNQNYMFDSKTEMLAFSDSIIVPTMADATRNDTVWNDVDTLKIDTIYNIGYTRFMPDDIVLRAFKEENPMQYLVKSEREKLNRFSLYFSAKADTLPTLKGLNFDETKLIPEHTEYNDTIVYWVTYTALCEKVTLTFQLDYLATDTLGNLVPRTDTLTMMNKIPKERRDAMAEDARKKEEKERKRREKRGDTTNVAKIQFLTMNVDAPSSLDLNKNVVIKFEEPIVKIDTAAFHLTVKEDSLWNDIPFIFRKDSVAYRQYEILANWEPEKEYKLTIDSAAVEGVYGLHTNKSESNMKVKTMADYSALYLNIKGARKGAYVQLLNSSDAVVRQQPVTDKNTCDFYFLQPGTKYYIRMFIDENGNGKWDTGSYEEKRHPEEVYYFHKVWDMKANFDFEETWDITERPLDKQKLDEIKKQKPEEEKKIKERNKERARKLGRTQ